jgi:hypothetical protein
VSVWRCLEVGAGGGSIGSLEVAYDLAHCRAVLMHLYDPEVVASTMVRALRRGGWLAEGLTDTVDEAVTRIAPGLVPRRPSSWRRPLKAMRRSYWGRGCSQRRRSHRVKAFGDFTLWFVNYMVVPAWGASTACR